MRSVTVSDIPHSDTDQRIFKTPDRRNCRPGFFVFLAGIEPRFYANSVEKAPRFYAKSDETAPRFYAKYVKNAPRFYAEKLTKACKYAYYSKYGGSAIC